MLGCRTGPDVPNTTENGSVPFRSLNHERHCAFLLRKEHLIPVTTIQSPFSLGPRMNTWDRPEPAPLPGQTQSRSAKLSSTCRFTNLSISALFVCLFVYHSTCGSLFCGSKMETKNLRDTHRKIHHSSFNMQVSK